MIFIERMTQKFGEEEAVMDKKLARVLLAYKFGLEAVLTRVRILQQEFQYIHEYNPIEHVKWRLKTPSSISRKAMERGCFGSLEGMRDAIRDIAGLRITCSFVSDIYRVAGMLMQQPDLEVVDLKDYIDTPKSNGYMSLHLIIRTAVFLSDRKEEVFVEVQLRTIAMDFWASLEHKIHYKTKESVPVPESLKEDLKRTASRIAELDRDMERIHKEMQELKLIGDREALFESPPAVRSKESVKKSMGYLSMIFEGGSL